MLLKDYEKWFDKLDDYWIPTINSDDSCTNCLDTYNTARNNLFNIINNWIKNDKDSKIWYLRALYAANAVYQLRYTKDLYDKYPNLIDIQSKFEEFKQLHPFLKNLLPDDISSLFAIVNDETNPPQHKLDTANFDNLTTNIQNVLNSFVDNCKSYIQDTGNILFIVSSSITFGNLAFSDKKPQINFDIDYYLRIANIKLAYVNSDATNLV